MTWFFNFLTSMLGPVFNYLNKRADVDAQKHISDNTSAGVAVTAVMNAQQNADNQNSETRRREGKWSPWVVVTIVGFMLPFAWHTWQVVLDSSAWHLVLDRFYLPHFVFHKVGSWKVAALPGKWSDTEHAVIQSLFVGASAALGAAGIIKLFRR
jgi:hypothetical protein